MPIQVSESYSIPLNAVQRGAIVDFNELVYKGGIILRNVEKCFCGNCIFEQLSRCDRFGLPFGTQICTDCGLISQTVQIHPDSMSLFYDQIYWPLIIGKSQSDISKNDFVTPPKLDEANSFILRSLDKSKKQFKIFEVGCGSGLRIKRLRDELQQMGHSIETFGSDYSTDAILQAKSNGIEVIKGGLEEISVYGKADILILSHVFEHFPDLNFALEKINNLISNDSLVYIEVPGVIDLENKKEYSFNYQYYCVLAHTYNFSLQSLVNVMSQGGFRLLSGDEYVRSIFVPGEFNGKINTAYQKTIQALERANKKQVELYTKRNQPIVKYLRNVVKSLLARTSN